jgi:periplasmic protein TonB
MITIINSNIKNIFQLSLLCSIGIHATIWGLSPDADRELKLNERLVKLLRELPSPAVTLDESFFVHPPSAEVTPEPQPKERVKSDVQPTPPKKKTVTRAKPKKKRRIKRRVKRAPVIKESSTSVVALAQETANPLEVSPPAEVVKADQPEVAPLVKRARLTRSQLRGLMKGYYQSLNTLMRRSRAYPRSARRQRIEGTVLVEMKVGASGEIISVKVARSSGHSVLDKAALSSVQQMKHLPSPPQELNWRARVVRIPFEYRLQS